MHSPEYAIDHPRDALPSAEARQPLTGEESAQVHLLVGVRAGPLVEDQGLVIPFALPGEHMAKERTDSGASAAE